MRARYCGVQLSLWLCDYVVQARHVPAMTGRGIDDARARARSLYMAPVVPLGWAVAGLAIGGLASERGEADGRPSGGRSAGRVQHD